MNLIEQIRVNDVSIDGYQGTYQIENSEWVRVVVDSEEKVLAGIRNDGTVEWGAGVPTPVREYVAQQLESKVDKEENKSLIGSSIADSMSLIDNPEYIQVTTDSEDKIVMGIKNDGAVYIPIIENESVNTINLKVDKEENKSLIDSSYADSMSSVENQEYLNIEIDAEFKVLGGRKIDGKKFENVGFDINGVNIEIVEDPEKRSEMIVDSEQKIISYRDENGILHENAGIYVNNLLLNKETEDLIKNLGSLGTNIAEILRETKYNLPNYGTVDIIQETFYLKKDNRVSTYNDVYVILDYEDNDANASAKITIGYWYIKSTLTDNGDGTYSKNENSVKLDYYASSKVTSLNGTYYVTSTLTEIVNPETSDISYEVDENSIEVTEIVGTPDVRTWPVDKKTEHKCVVNINFEHYLNGMFYIGVKFLGSSTLNYRERNFRFTFYKNSSYAKKDKVKIGELLRLSGFNLKANWTDPTKLKEIILYRFILSVQAKRDFNNQYPWLNDNPYCGATGTINGFPIRVSIGGAFYGIDIFGLKKDEKNYMLDKAKLVDENVVEGTGIFASGTGGSYVDGFFRDSWSVHPEYWEDEMNDDEVLITNEHTPADSASLIDFLTFINSNDFDKEHVPARMNIVSWIDYFILMQVFVMYDNTSRNVILYSDNDRTKFYAYFYDLDLAWNINSPRTTYNADILADGTSFCKDMTPWVKLWDVYKDEVINRYSELRKTVLTTDYLNTIYQSILKYIPLEDIQNQKTRWNRDVTTADMSSYMTWLSDRLNWLDENYFKI